MKEKYISFACALRVFCIFRFIMSTSFLHMRATKKFTPTGSYKLHDVRMYVGRMYAELMNAILTENVQQGNKEQGEDAAEKMQEDLINVQFRPDVSSALMHLLSLSDCTTAVFYDMAESVFEHLSECYFNDFKGGGFRPPTPILTKGAFAP
jgi:hypothetical protein